MIISNILSSRDELYERMRQKPEGVEVDSDAELAQTATKSSWTSLDIDHVSYLHKDHGAANFGVSLTHEWEAFVTKIANFSRPFGWALTNTIGTRKMVADASGDCLAVGYYTQSAANKVDFIVVEVEAGSVTENTDSDIPALADDTLYYLRAVRTSGNLELSVFTDSGRTTHASGSPTNTTIADTAYRYLEAPMNRGESSAQPGEGYTGNLELDAAGGLTVADYGRKLRGLLRGVARGGN